MKIPTRRIGYCYLLLTLFVASFAIGLLPGVASSHANVFYWRTWQTDPDYYVGTLSGLPSGAANKIHLADDPWDGTPGAWLDFDYAATYSGTSWSGCPSSIENKHYIYSYSYGSSSSNLAATTTCTNSSNTIKRTYTRINKDKPWWTGNNTPSNYNDLQGVMIHEFGHASGFGGHFSWNDPVCADSSTIHAMCTGNDYSDVSWKGSDGVRMRTIELHEKNLFAGWY